MGLTREEALKILGLEDGSSQKEIRDRFKKLALKWHPDKNFHSPDESQKKFQAISAAYTRLVASEETDDEISTETLGEMFAEIWEVHNRGHKTYDPHAHLFCDCDVCQGEWAGMDYGDILGSDSDYDDDDYDKDDRSYADRLLREFADRLYRNYNGSSRMTKKGRSVSTSQWSGSVYRRKHITAEEASRNADELLKAEEEEKKLAEKRRLKNKRKKEAKKKRKASQVSTGSGDGACGGDGDGSADEEEGKGDERVGDEEGAAMPDGRQDSKSEDDNEIDITCAFVARASKKQAQQMAKGRPTGSGVLEESGSEQGSQEGEGPELNGDDPIFSSANGLGIPVVNLAPTTTVSEGTYYEPNIGKSRQLAAQGNKAAKDGRFQEAVRKYNEAIEQYPFDHRYFGNRSFCYDFLHDYNRALEDANTALKLDSHWAKGYYRKGRALAGLKRYEEAEKAYTKAVQLDPNYKDASDELFQIRMEQLQTMGFPSDVSCAAIREHESVQSAVDAILAGKVNMQLAFEEEPGDPFPAGTLAQQSYVPVYNSSGFEIPPRMLINSQITNQRRSLWVGNLSSSIAEDMILDLFQQYGEVHSIRMLIDRHCCFVNFVRPEAAAEALKGLQGYHIGGCYLLLRYPENTTKGSGGSAAGGSAAGGNTAVSTPPRTKKSGPVNGNECYFWRTTGCAFGPKCRYKHVGEHEGIDLPIQ